MPPPDPNNTYTKPPSENQILRFIKTLGYDEDPKTKMIAISKMVATRLHQSWRAILSVLKRSLTRKDSSWDIVRLPILHDTLGGDYKFGMEIPDRMISDAIKKLAGYKFYMAKKVESENAKTVDEPEEQHVSAVKSGKQDLRLSLKKQLQRQTEEAIANMYNEWGQKLKSPAVDDPAVQSLLDLRKGSKANTLENTNSDAILHSSSSDKIKQCANEPMMLTNLIWIYPMIIETEMMMLQAFEKVVQARVLTELKKLLPTHIPKAVANYVRPRLNTFMLKIKLLNRIHLNKSNDNHTTHQQLYDTLYESIILDEEALDAQDVEPSFHKRSHDNQDPPKNHKGENKKKKRKNVSEPSSRSSRRNKSPMDHAQVDTAAMQPLDQADEYVRNHPNLEWFPKKSGSANAKSRMTWTRKAKQQYQNDVEVEYHVDQLKAALLTEAKWNIKRSDDKEYEFSYTNIPKLSLNDVEKMYLLQVQDKLYDLPLEFVKDFNNELLLFIRRVLSEVKMFCDGTLIKIRENLFDMVKKNKLGNGNKWLKGRDWTDMDVEKSNEMVDKINKVLKRREQIKMLEEYVGGRPKFC
ncbi:hypothetical protein Tco_0912188 [Tanacetum coccineum]